VVVYGTKQEAQCDCKCLKIDNNKAKGDGATLVVVEFCKMVAI
jgi:hypothetical protein